MNDLCLKIENARAQFAKNVLLRHRLLDPGRSPARETGHVVFPLTSMPGQSVQNEIGHPFELVRGACKPSSKRGRGTLVELLDGKLPRELLPLVPRSFSITGRTCILELDPTLDPFRDAIAKALYRLHPAVETIYAKASGREGAFRTRELELVNGPDDPTTTHVENGYTFHLDIKEVFFDPRLGNEHGRVVEAIRSSQGPGGHVVLDLFCGAGPFIVPLSRVPGIVTWAVDMNLVAIDLAKDNVKRNKGDMDSLHVFCMDAMHFLNVELPRHSPPPAFDAILMNLPSDAHRFLEPATPWLSDRGKIFFYTIAPALFEGKRVEGMAAKTSIDGLLAPRNGEREAAPADEIERATAIGRAIASGLEIDVITRVKAYAPYKFIYCIELVHGSST